MRLFVSFFIALAFLQGCSSALRQADPGTNDVPANAAAERSARASSAGESEANFEVVDPAAPGAQDHFPGAVLPPVKAGEAEAPAERPNALAPGFLIRLGHQEDRDLNGSFRIDFDGKISLPYNVSFKAEGLTMEEFRQKVMESYRPFFKSGVRLSVELVEKSYFIELRGLITKPGKYRVKSDASIDEVIAMGGGFPVAQDSQPRYLRITRGEQSRVVSMDEYYKSGSLRSAMQWRGGEVVFFQKDTPYTDLGGGEPSNQVQVIGELKRPGEFAFRPGADVYFYLAEAGGPTRDLDFFKIQIFRGPPGKRVMTEFDLEHPEKVPLVQAGDILVFQSDKPSPFQKHVGTAANIASILTAIALLILAL